MGVSGENSYQIAFRAGGIGVYIDRDITISESQTALARLIDDNGDVFTSSDYSGYGWDTNPDAGTMYINGYLCDVENADDDTLSILDKAGITVDSIDYIVDCIKIKFKDEKSRDALFKVLKGEVA